MFKRKFQIVTQVVGTITLAFLAVYGLMGLIENGVAGWTEEPEVTEEASAPSLESSAGSVPQIINYQGYAKDPEGNPLSGRYTMTFRIYSHVVTGNALWEEQLQNVTVRAGDFSVLLGDTTPLPETLFDEPDRFIGLTINPYHEMVPRQRFATVPYTMQANHAAEASHAINAANADEATHASQADNASQAERAFGLNASDGDPQNAVIVDADGNVGIGTTSPEAKLHVAGNVKVEGDIELSGNTSFGPHFIDPVTVASGGGGAVEYTTFDASSHVPTNATAVILEAEAAMDGPDGGDVDAHIRIRKDSSSRSYILLRGRAIGGSDGAAWASQGIYPINNSTFEYGVDAPGFNHGYEIRLIGYFN